VLFNYANEFVCIILYVQVFFNVYLLFMVMALHIVILF
jgi:hypothetical protein